jgi:hypothetical protein
VFLIVLIARRSFEHLIISIQVISNNLWEKVRVAQNVPIRVTSGGGVEGVGGLSMYVSNDLTALIRSVLYCPLKIKGS